MFTAADYVLLTILAVSMGIGLWRGFIVEVLSLTVWIGAFWLTIAFGATAASWLGGIESVSARFFLGHAGVFLAVLLLGGALTWAIGKVIANTGLSPTDRVLGLGFGLARGVVLACVAVLLLGFTPMPQDGWWRESRLIPEAQRGAEWMVGFLPADAAAQIRFPSPFDLVPSGTGETAAGADSAAALESAPPAVEPDTETPASPPGDAVPVPET